jgi:hypothetical protein
MACGGPGQCQLFNYVLLRRARFQFTVCPYATLGRIPRVPYIWAGPTRNSMIWSTHQALFKNAVGSNAVTWQSLNSILRRDLQPHKKCINTSASVGHNWPARHRCTVHVDNAQRHHSSNSYIEQYHLLKAVYEYCLCCDIETTAMCG